jgi:alanyl-tRNA synthetase
MKLPKDKLWITVFEKDDEAEALWQSEVGVSKDRIKRLGEKDNFWSMGETGPCGPCSEIHYDHGKEFGCGKPSCAIGCDCDRFMEIWNLVFMQFERDADGHMKPLPKPSIDTGMGLERLSAVAQGVHANYDSDLFTPLIREVEKLTGKKYTGAERASGSAGASGAGGHGGSAQAYPHYNDEQNVSIRVLCDHIRSATFLIADGVQPSNEGRGYVLRRVLRRAIRHGKLLGMNEPFFYKLADLVLKEMGPVYPEIGREIETIKRVVRSEEEKFLETLDKGLAIIKDELETARKAKERVLSGEVVFKLYDTYGFPIDLTELIAQEAGLDIDMAGFEELMEAQKGRGRRAWKGSAASKMKDIYQQIVQKNIHSEFVGYDRLKEKSPVAAMVRVADEQIVDKAGPGEEVEIVTLKTPFYPEGGGQAGDQGLIAGKNLKAKVLDTHKGGELVVHRVKLLEGKVQEGDELDLAVDPQWREGAMTHHSATHLLHAALRNVLGTHVRQAGSLVTPEKLRFDFSHFEPVSKERLDEIEEIVNEQIRRNLAVQTSVLPYDEAIKAGALAFFGDKYGDLVRVLKMGDFSMEFCGGTHVSATGQIGLLKITSESSVAAGIRRVEAVVGAQGIHYVKKLESEVGRIAQMLKANPNDIVDRVEKLMDQVKKLEKDLQKAKTKGADAGGEQEEVKDVNGVKVLTSIVAVDDPKLLRDISDQKIQKLGSGIAALGAVSEGKVTLIVRVSKDLASKYHAGNILKEISPIVGGTGGGRPDMAQGGGSKPEALKEALQKVVSLI